MSMGVCSDGSYGVPEGLIAGFPVTTNDGAWSIVDGLDIDDFSRARIDASVAELAEERDTVRAARPARVERGRREGTSLAARRRPFGASRSSTSERGVRAIGLPDDDLARLVG